MTEFLAFIRGSGVTTTVAAFGVLHPAAERLVGDAKVLGDAGQRAVTAANETHGLSVELRRIDWFGAGQTNTSSWASRAP